MRTSDARRDATPHFFERGQFLQTLQPELHQELVAGAVQLGATRRVGHAGNLDEALLKQLVEGMGYAHAANGFHLGAGDGLLVGHDGQRFEHGLGEAAALLNLEELADVRGMGGLGDQLVAAANLLHHEGNVRVFVDLLGQFAQQVLDDFLLGVAKGFRQA
jgi:hypothetical protein